MNENVFFFSIKHCRETRYIQKGFLLISFPNPLKTCVMERFIASHESLMKLNGKICSQSESLQICKNKTESKFSPRSRANGFYSYQFFQIYPNLFKSIQIFSNLSKSFQIYPNLFKFIKLSLPLKLCNS